MAAGKRKKAGDGEGGGHLEERKEAGTDEGYYEIIRDGTIRSRPVWR